MNFSKVKKTDKKNLLFCRKKIMKKFSSFLLLFLAILIFAGCKNSVVYEEKVIFQNDNWAWEYKAINFKAPLISSKDPYSIILDLELVGIPNIDIIPIAFSMTTPKGGKTIKSPMINFNSPKEPYIIKNSKEKIYRLTVYPKKYFSETGEYTFEVNQFSTKADNYGIHSLTLRIEKVKE